MKKNALVLWLMFIAVVVSSCSKENNLTTLNGSTNSEYSYSISAVDSNKNPVSMAKVFIATEDGDIYSQCDDKGVAALKLNKPIKSVICACYGKYGFAVLEKDMPNIEITMQNLKVPSPQSLAKAQSIGTYGVYSTDSHGDVSFRYKGNFVNYYYTSYMPAYLPGKDPWFQNTNPNTWDGWVLTDWLPTWKGKKLLVPQRCQWFYTYTHGFSISLALFMTTN
jgi:hypothetical protein